MANTFFGLTIGASGLHASNAAVNTVAHNIANINTEGYSRQHTDQKASFAIRVYSSYGTVGTGVKVVDIEQTRSEYYDSRFRNNNAHYGEYTTLHTYSTLVEDYLDEFSMEGFVTEYNNLFNAMSGLISDPASDVRRNQFVNYMSSISNYFNTLSKNLSNVQNDINTEVVSSVDTINSIAEQISKLNRQINVITANGGEANDLKDERNLLVDELSGYINTTVSERDMGDGVTNYIVYINNQPLVDGYNYNELQCVARDVETRRNASDIDGLYNIKWNNGLPFNMYDPDLKGSLKALIDFRDGCNESYEKVVTDANGNQVLEVIGDTYKNSAYKGIPYYQSQLNEFVQTFAAEFNAIISKGYTADGELCTDSFLVSGYDNGYISAADIRVNQVFIDDLGNLPLSYDITKGIENSDMASDLFALKEKETMKNGTFWDYLSSIVSEVAVDSGRSKNFAQNYTTIRETIDNQRTSIQGVDEDEEGVDLVRYQNAYGLASKVISVMNEIYSKLINETGL